MTHYIYRLFTSDYLFDTNSYALVVRLRDGLIARKFRPLIIIAVLTEASKSWKKLPDFNLYPA